MFLKKKRNVNKKRKSNLRTMEADEQAQVSQVVSRGAGFNRAAEPLEKRVGIAAPEEFPRIEPCRPSLSERLTVCHRSRRGAVSVDAVRSRAEHYNRLARNLFDARKNERRISAAHAVSRHRAAQFSVCNHGHVPARIRLPKPGELPEQKICGLVDRPVVGGMVARAYATVSLGRPVRVVEKVVRSKQNLEKRALKSGIAGFG